MAVICENEDGWVIDHKQTVNDTYHETISHNADDKGPVYVPFKYRADLFDIQHPFMMDSQFQAAKKEYSQTAAIDGIGSRRKKQKKRKAELTSGEEKAAEYHNSIKNQVFTAYSSLLELGKKGGYFNSINQPVHTDNNLKARSAAKLIEQTDDGIDECLCYQKTCTSDHPEMTVKQSDSIPVTTVIDRMVHYHGDTPTVITLSGDQYLLPSHCSFLLSDFSHLHLIESSKEFSPFNLIVIDPPWQNKSVKRLKTYNRLNNENFLEIPIPKLAEDNCIVVIWVTNRWQHMQFIKNSLFPKWCVQLKAEWHWIKVTKTGDMVYPFESKHRKPYEVLLIGKYHANDSTDIQPNKTKITGSTCSACEIPPCKTIISIPSCIHSMKPPLHDVLKEYLPPDPRCLELFARNLVPGWTSWGNQVLKHQHVQLFDAIT